MSLRSNSGSPNESNNALAPSSVCVGDPSDSILSEVTGTPIRPKSLSTAEADPEAAGLPPTPRQRFFAPIDFDIFEDGYDSDGYIPPHLVGIDCIDDLDQCEVPIGSHDRSGGENTNRQIFCQNLRIQLILVFLKKSIHRLQIQIGWKMVLVKIQIPFLQKQK